jgi:hypothetical protein
LQETDTGIAVGAGDALSHGQPLFRPYVKREPHMKEKVSEQLDALVFAVTQIIFGPEATQFVYQHLVRLALEDYGITEAFLRESKGN